MTKLSAARRAELVALFKGMNLQPWRRHEAQRWNVCRFCQRGAGEITHFWKYGIRHYICDACKDRIEAQGAK